MTLNRSKGIREEIESDFRPIFADRELEGGIPLVELRGRLEQSNLPPKKVTQFLTNADRDRDAKITYTEFYNQILQEDESTLRKLALRKRVMNHAVRAIAPDRAKLVHMQGIDAADYMNWGEAKVENYAELYDCKPPPFFIPVITLVEIGVFIYYAVKLNTDDNRTNDVNAREGLDINSPLVYNPFRRDQAWRFVSYMMMHQGYVHLIFNCVIQLILGTLLEIVHKWWRVGIVYIMGVAAGSLANSVFDSRVFLVGASGGCYALIGAHLATIITNFSTMQKGWCENPINFLNSGVFRLVVILVLAGGDTALAMYDRLTSELPTKIGYSAHFGGALAGVLLGIPVLRNIEVTKAEKILFWVSLGLYCGLMTAGIIFNIICAQYNLCYAVKY